MKKKYLWMMWAMIVFICPAFVVAQAEVAKKHFSSTVTSSREDSAFSVGLSFTPTNEPINEEEEEAAKSGAMTFGESPFTFSFNFQFYQSRVNRADRAYKLHLETDYSFKQDYFLGFSWEVGHSALDQVGTTMPMLSIGMDTGPWMVSLGIGWLHSEQSESPTTGQAVTSTAGVFKFNQRVTQLKLGWAINKQWDLRAGLTRYLIDSDLTNRVNQTDSGTRSIARNIGSLNSSVATVSSDERRLGISYQQNPKWQYGLDWAQNTEMLTQTSSADTSLSVNYSFTKRFEMGFGVGYTRSIESLSGYGLISTNYNY